MALSPSQLNDVDRWILDFLGEHEWASVQLLRAFYLEDEGEISRQWMSERVGRLREHEHLERVLETSTYRLVEDPREEPSA
jgi:hypothetical protein